MTIRISIQNLEDEKPSRTAVITDHSGDHWLSGGEEFQTYLWKESPISIRELVGLDHD